MWDITNRAAAGMAVQPEMAEEWAREIDMLMTGPEDDLEDFLGSGNIHVSEVEITPFDTKMHLLLENPWMFLQ